MDRWSKRVIGAIASDLNSKAVYPSDGPPYAPFYTWAVLSEKAFVSPLKLLVHEDVGLMISYRGALVLDKSLKLPVSSDKSPCEACSKPCISACPADAFSIDGMILMLVSLFYVLILDKIRVYKKDVMLD